MRREIDYDWTKTIDLPERKIICGFCGENITTRVGYSGWVVKFGQKHPLHIYICHVCASPNLFDDNNKQVPRYKKIGGEFTDTIKSISPKFISIYEQTLIAENEKLSEIIGPGFRKALEFLIKDYVTKLNPKDEDEVKKKFLGKVIKKWVKNRKIEEAASRATWLGNDETHYTRKWLDKDVNDLKKLIDMVVYWIQGEELHREYVESMPSPAPEE